MAIAVIYFSFLGLSVMTARELSEDAIPLPDLFQASVVQTVDYVKMLFTGELGSVVLVLREEQVSDILLRSYKNSIGLMAISLTLAIFIGTLLGMVAAIRRRGKGAYGMLFATMLGVSIPSFLLAILLQRGGIWYTTTMGKQLVNMGGYGWDYKHLLMPVLVLAGRPLAHISRLVYISLTEIMSQDYIRTARAKGLREYLVILIHAGANLATSLLTAIGVSIRFTLGILPLVEFLFGWPGLGLLALTSIRRRLPLLLIAIALSFGFTLRLIELLIQALNRTIDPQYGETA